MPTDAVIFTQPARLMDNIKTCSQYCLEHDYRVVAIIRGDWGEAVDYIAGRLAEVIVVADDDDLPPYGRPRVEVVADAPATAAASDVYRPARRTERTRVIRRGAGG